MSPYPWRSSVNSEDGEQHEVTSGDRSTLEMIHPPFSDPDGIDTVVGRVGDGRFGFLCDRTSAADCQDECEPGRLAVL